jgi:hypothetical protein
MVQISATPVLKHIQQQVSKKQQNVIQTPFVNNVFTFLHCTFKQWLEQITENT